MREFEVGKTVKESANLGLVKNELTQLSDELGANGELDWKFKKGNWLFVNTESSGLIFIERVVLSRANIVYAKAFDR